MQQLSTQNVSAMEVVKNTLRNRGVFGLYKAVSYTHLTLPTILLV